jgi:2-polyprenyl-6-methoxyphenol hydroxylase-like FAD-dependent oxidoreductase
MQDEHIVRDLQVLDGERTVKARYFVESGMIHANIDGRTMRLPVGADGSEETVRRLVLGQIQVRTWRDRMLERWRRR